jgi:hypothetical protein
MTIIYLMSVISDNGVSFPNEWFYVMLQIRLARSNDNNTISNCRVYNFFQRWC